MFKSESQMIIIHMVFASIWDEIFGKLSLYPAGMVCISEPLAT